jgi:hypothetical protein
MPTNAPTSSPTVYVPYEPPAEIGNLLDPSSLSLHVILIMVALILACIFVAYLGMHLARKYHPEWFRPGKRKKRKKKQDKKDKDKGKATSRKKDEIKGSVGQVSDSGKITKRHKLMSVKPITTDEENKLSETAPVEVPLSPPGKSISSIVPMEGTEPKEAKQDPVDGGAETREVEPTSPSGKRSFLEVPDFLRDPGSALPDNAGGTSGSSNKIKITRELPKLSKQPEPPKEPILPSVVPMEKLEVEVEAETDQQLDIETGSAGVAPLEGADCAAERQPEPSSEVVGDIETGEAGLA